MRSPFVALSACFGLLALGCSDLAARATSPAPEVRSSNSAPGVLATLTVDPVNDRAWVGGVITRNNSTHPFFTRDINDPGRDIWFRAVDYGEGENASQVDRTTFVGFEGNAGIITSREYCDRQIWPEGDARTNPVTQGNIDVRVR